MAEGAHGHDVCNRCYRKLPVEDFMRTRRNQVVLAKYRMCNFCHIRAERRAVQAVPEEGESDEEFEGEESSKSRNLECEYVHLVEEMRDLFEEEESSRGTVIAYCKVTLQEEILKEVLRSENEKVVDQWIRNIPLADLETGSGYYWVLRNVKRSNDSSKFSTTLACSSRSDLGLTRRTARANQPYERRPEKKRKIDRYDCRGVVNVKVCIEKKEMELTLTHLCPHPKPEYKGDAVPDAELRRIEEMAGTNIRRGDVYRMLCLEGLIDPERIRRAHVNFWMAEKLAKLYVRNADNQLLSSKQLIESSQFQSKGFEVVFYEDTATLAAISFVTPFWCRVSSVKEIVIDSTFKTNSLRFELFCISANFGGVVHNVVHDWTGEEFQTEADIGHPEPTNDTDDYLQKFKEKWLKLVQNTEYLVEKEHDNEKFIEAVDKALYSFDRAIGQCMTALRSGRQQQTWAKTGPSMWLR
ncbi:hypothetical protein R1sor_004366 [Riccia sorocarpa]|uniref:Uncharacterized protein n=1 Tax=Riccia sorocarpa TaxID=122646 RepID=A0ABD3HK91_9MARC